MDDLLSFAASRRRNRPLAEVLMPLDPAEFARIGMYRNGARLAEQGAATLALAEKHLAALGPFGITKARLTEYRALAAAVQKGASDRTLARDEATAATEDQNRAFLGGKDWLRKLLAIGENAFVGDPTTLKSFQGAAKIGSSLPNLVQALRARLELAKKHAGEIAEWGGTAAFLKQGGDLLAKLEAADAQQEALAKGLPKVTQDYYRQRGELMVALKRINRAAKAAFLDDRALRSQFNLDILYRGATSRKPAKAVPVT